MGVSLNSSDLKSVFESSVFLTDFQISAAHCGQGLSFAFAEESYWFNKDLETSLNL